jgi:hypothetical protein
MTPGPGGGGGGAAGTSMGHHGYETAAGTAAGPAILGKDKAGNAEITPVQVSWCDVVVVAESPNLAWLGRQRLTHRAEII